MWFGNKCLLFAGVLKNIYREGDTLILTHCPELPSLPSFTFKSTFLSHTLLLLGAGLLGSVMFINTYLGYSHCHQ